MKKILMSLLFCWQMAVFANTVTLVNDSPFPLDVIIYAADGTVLGQYSLQPKMQQKWTNDYEYGTTIPNPTDSQTPYSVIWTCQEGTEYGVCTTVSPGAEVFAQGCQGPLMCKPKKKPAPGGQPQTTP